MPAGEPRVLVTTADVPWPPHTGKSIRSNHLCRAAARVGTGRILVVGAPGHGRHRATRTGAGLSFDMMPVRQVPTGVAIGRVIGRRWPTRVALADWAWVEQELVGEPVFDLAIFGAAEHWAVVGPAVRARHVVVDMDDIESQKALAVLRAGRRRGAPALETVRAAVNLMPWRRLESQVVRSGATLITASDLDATRLTAGRAHVVPNSYPEHAMLPLSRGSATIALVGNFDYAPNADAARFAVMEILPEIRAVLPDARLRIIGHGSQRLPTLLRGAPGVSYAGPVPSMPRALEGCAVSLCPIRFGGGTRVKLVEAFCLGIPAASTTVGAEGLGATAGEHLLIADDAPGLAAACVRLISDEVLAARLTDNARRLYERDFTPAVAQDRLSHAIRAAMATD